MKVVGHTPVFRTASNNGCLKVDLSKIGGIFIGDISFLEMFEESADAVLYCCIAIASDKRGS